MPPMSAHLNKYEFFFMENSRESTYNKTPVIHTKRKCFMWNLRGSVFDVLWNKWTILFFGVRKIVLNIYCKTDCFPKKLSLHIFSWNTPSFVSKENFTVRVVQSYEGKARCAATSATVDTRPSSKWSQGEGVVYSYGFKITKLRSHIFLF